MTSLMQRKARIGRDAQAARAMSLGRALRLTAAKQADQMMKLAVSALGVTRRCVAGEEVAGSLDKDWLILLMDGPGTQVAAAVLEPVLVAGLIQQQTMGRVTAVQQGAPVRQHTATDASLCAPFVEALLARAALLPEDPQDRALLQGYRFGVWAEEPRKAQLALEASDYEMVEVTLDLAAGVRAGRIMLVLPHPVRAVPPPAQDDDAEPLQALGGTLAHNVMGLQAELMVALTRIRMPLQRVSALKPGDLLDLNLTTMAQALIIDGSGRAISRGTLGQIDGMRAVQVEQQAAAQHGGPRRRASDRAGLDLPDVTAPAADTSGKRRSDVVNDPVAQVPKLSDVDIFGDLDDLPDMPDLGADTAGSDTRMTGWDMPDDTPEDMAQGGAQRKQAGS